MPLLFVVLFCFDPKLCPQEYARSLLEKFEHEMRIAKSEQKEILGELQKRQAAYPECKHCVFCCCCFYLVDDSPPVKDLSNDELMSRLRNTVDRAAKGLDAASVRSLMKQPPSNNTSDNKKD